MATTADIKNGMCIELDGKTFSIVEFLHVKPGKGPAFVRTKLRNLENGRVLDKTFSLRRRSGLQFHAHRNVRADPYRPQSDQ